MDLGRTHVVLKWCICVLVVNLGIRTIVFILSACLFVCCDKTWKLKILTSPSALGGKWNPWSTSTQWLLLFFSLVFFWFVYCFKLKPDNYHFFIRNARQVSVYVLLCFIDSILGNRYDPGGFFFGLSKIVKHPVLGVVCFNTRTSHCRSSETPGSLTVTSYFQSLWLTDQKNPGFGSWFVMPPHG